MKSYPSYKYKNYVLEALKVKHKDMVWAQKTEFKEKITKINLIKRFSWAG